MKVKVLDCTLRDGAYVVDSKFKEQRIKNIINTLEAANVDIVECGWLRDCKADKDSVNYFSPGDVEKYISKKRSKYALMFDYGKFDINRLPQNNGLIDIIRIAFYKNNLDEISFTAGEVKSRGYEVFLQPSNVMEYSEEELEKLCKRANYLGVNSVYIVDSFGSMFMDDLEKIMPVFTQTVNDNIEIGFHSHNSIQMSLALSIQFIKSMTRNIVVDSSLCGIGRGAGNTKTELLLEYLNRNGYNYNTPEIWKGIEENILPLYKDYNWEYLPQKGLKGLRGIHPNRNLIL